MAVNKQPWTGLISASQSKVSEGEAIEFTVTLKHDEHGVAPFNNENSEFYNCFSYHYACAPLIEESAENLENPLTIEELPSGHYRISAKIKVKHEARTLTPSVTFADGSDLSVAMDALGRELNRNPIVTEPPATFDVVADAIKPPLNVNATLQRTFVGHTRDQGLWPAIRNRTAAIGFDRYKKFIDCVFCPDKPNNPFADIRSRTRGYVDNCLDLEDTSNPNDIHQLSIYGPYAYGVLKLATQAFLTLESGVVIRNNDPNKPPIVFMDKEGIRRGDSNLLFTDLTRELGEYLGDTSNRLPYLNKIIKNLVNIDGGNPQEVLPYCLGVLQYRLTSPSLIELIWSYWHEEGMLVQTMNAVAFRFQNRRTSQNDPLGELEFDPLRPLNNLIWGFIQDEHNRLTVPRRAYEYQHHYGLSLLGKAVPNLTPADIRSKFIEGFHNLLAGAARFYQQDSDTTVIADGFPLLNALKEVHLLLAEGAHNQFGDLTWTSRAEMLMMQWMLARPEMKEFLRGRYMVPYQEDWMGAVDSMKKLQGWTDTTITHFHELAVTGERILLSIRYGDWSDLENIEEQAKNWARNWKPEIQRYLHGYRTVTGVDLMAEITDSRDAATRFLQPSALLQRRLAEQASATSLPSSRRAGLLASRASGRAEMPAPKRAALPIYRKET